MTENSNAGTVEQIKARRDAEDKAKADAAAKAASDAKADSDAKAKASDGNRGKAKAPVAYTSTADAYVDNKYYKAGEVFVTDAIKGDDWTKVSAKEAAAIQASTDRVPDDANLEAADKSALQAVAIIKHVPIAGLDKPALITAIKAAYEPAL